MRCEIDAEAVNSPVNLKFCVHRTPLRVFLLHIFLPVDPKSIVFLNGPTCSAFDGRNHFGRNEIRNTQKNASVS